MLSPVASLSGISPGLAGAPALPDAAESNDAATTGAQNPSVQISISAEAELTMTTYEATQISISADSQGAARDGSQPQDPDSAKALSTLKSVAASERAWIAALKASYEGKKAPKPQADGATPANSTPSADDQGGGVQITVQQETEVQVSLAVSAQVDIQT